MSNDIIDDIEHVLISSNPQAIDISIIEQSKASFPSSSLLESALSNKFEDKQDEIEFYDVIIIGAGLAGLSAGYNLKKADKNLNILIVEAKNRIGGRTQTIKLKSSKADTLAAYDVGGQWVCDTQVHVTSLLKEFNIPTYKQYDKGISVLEANGKLSKYKTKIPNISLSSLIDLQFMMMKMNRLCTKTSTLDPFIVMDYARSLDKSNIEEVLYKNAYTSTSKSIFDAAIRAIYGLEASQLNALFGLMYIKSGGGSIEAISLTEKDCAQEKRVKGGTQQISQHLLNSILSDPSRAKIIFESPLVEVNQEQADRVFIKVSNLNANCEEIYCCKKLISSIPINQYSTIKFSPSLPFNKRNFFSFCRIGNYIKTVITYKKAFWLEKGYSGMVVSDSSIISDNNTKSQNYPKYGPLTTVFDGTTDDGEPALVTFSCGNPAVEWQDQEYEVRKNEVINALVRYFGLEASDYIDYYEKNWNSELYGGGCPNISVVASGTMHEYARATREPFLNLHICGTESATQWQGYMDGAIESGIRVANEVAYCFNKTNPNVKFDFTKTYYFQNEEIHRLKFLNNQSTGFSFRRRYVLIAASVSIICFCSYKYLTK